MTYIAPRVEALARAMCVALDYDPDREITIYRDREPAESLHPWWWLHHQNAYEWIYEHSGGELPEREGEG